MIDPQTVQRIKDAADIVEVVSDYVKLTRRGANYMGLCPFHNERTPSFSVNRARNFCYCFSCHKGGSPVNFIMEKEGIGYHEALLQLAAKYGIKVEERELTDEERARQSEREAMLNANEWAMRRMEDNLYNTPEGRDVGLQYLYGRGLTDEAIRKFRLGYSPDRGNDLCEAARREGYDLNILKKLGLVGTSQRGTDYDRFRGRVIFPIVNISGKVIAFGGRDLKGTSPAKYINSPESDLYKKSNELYGIFQARGKIGNQDRCFLVEGYMDVIGMWQSGMENVVASSGTALTDGQIALIHRLTNNVTLIYDGDNAGIKASLRGMDMLLSHNLNVRLLLLPDGDDPDSFARKNTPEQFRDYLKEHETDIIRFKARVLMEQTSGDPQKRAEAIASIVRSIACINDEITRNVYIQECSQLMGMNESVLARATAKVRAEIVEKWKEERRRKKELKALDADSSRPGSAYSPSSSQQPGGASGTATASPQNGSGASSQSGPGTPAQNGAAASTQGGSGTPSAPSGSATLAAGGRGVHSYPLAPFEREIARYCVRYGLMPLMATTDENGQTTDLLVVDYIAEEMIDDKIDFTVEAYAKVFDEVDIMRDTFINDLKAFTEDLDKRQQEELRRGYEEIAAKDLDLAGIRNEEDELQQRVAQKRAEELAEFTSDYAARRLASHQDDLVRTTASDLIVEPYHLSKYHSKTAVITHERDRLDELVPRAVLEWKDGILGLEIASLRRQMAEAVDRGDMTDVVKLQRRSHHLMAIRKQVALQIGERTVRR